MARRSAFRRRRTARPTADRDTKLIWSLADTSDNSWSNPSLFGTGLFYELGRTDIPMQSTPAPQATPTPEPTPDRFVSLNQLGYFADAPKYAMIAGTSGEAAGWSLADAATGAVGRLRRDDPRQNRRRLRLRRADGRFLGGDDSRHLRPDD